MRRALRLRWFSFGIFIVLGIVLGIASENSGRFYFAACVVTGIVLFYILEAIGPNILFGSKHALIFKQTLSIIKDAQRLKKRARKKLDPSIQEDIGQALQECIAAINQDQWSQVPKKTQKLQNIVENNLTQFRKAQWRETIEPIAVAILVALALRGFAVEAFEIPSGSMIPSLYVGDKIFVNKLTYGFRVPFVTEKFFDFGEPKRGDIAVFVYPIDPDENFVKRVIGLPGDTVEVNNEVLYVNNEPVSRVLIKDVKLWDVHRNGQWYEKTYHLYEETLGDNTYHVIYDPQRRLPDFPATKVKPGHLFMMGDNRDNSSDSREWGFVPMNYLIGKSMFIWWSQGPGLNTERFFRWVD